MAFVNHNKTWPVVGTKTTTSSLEMLNVSTHPAGTTLEEGQDAKDDVKDESTTTTTLLRPHSPAIPGGSIDEIDEDNSHQLRGTNWLWEILGWLLSVLCFTAIVGVLIEYDGKTVPHLPLNIKLNSIISILATFGLSALMLPIDAGLGQLKWNRLRRKLPLAEFAQLDQASRGPYGSLLLLSQLNTGWLPRLGALATVLSLAVSPFVQQVVTYTDAQSPAGQATMPVTTSWGGKAYSLAEPFPYMIAATYTGIYDDPSTSPQVRPICSTGNCTFADYETLSVCSSCSNLTALVLVVPWSYEEGEPSTQVNYTLPNGFSMPNFELAPSSSGADGGFLHLLSMDTTSPYNYTSVAYGTNGSLLLDFFGIAEGGQAFECILQWCVRGYRSRITNGQLVEAPLYEWSDNSAAARGVQEGGSQVPLLLSRPGDNNEFYVGWAQLSPVAVTLANLFTGSYIQLNAGLNGWGSSDSMTALAGIMGLERSVGDQNAVPSSGNGTNLTALFTVVDALANCLSVAIRNNPDTGFMANGASWSNETMVRVDWAWLALPFSLVLASLVFLMCVILDTRAATRGMPLAPLKTDILPVLLWGIDEDARGALQRAAKTTSLAKASKRMQMELLEKTEGVRMVAK